jgi:hypothetical protein
MSHTRWPDQNDLHQLTKGRFARHSQSVQAVFRAFLGTIETTRTLRREHPEMQMKYPWREKRFYPVHWPAQAVSVEKGRVVLPMGSGIRSLKRQRSKQLGQLGRLQSGCQKHSRRWKKLQRARNTVCRRAERRVRDPLAQGHASGH